MPNIVTSRLIADDWTPLYAPVPCYSIVVENADPELGFQTRSIGEPAGERTIQPGMGIEIHGDGSSLQPTELLCYVKGGEIVISAGMSLQFRTSQGAGGA